MSGLALTIVFIAAFLHATWNTMAQRSRKKIIFVWWFQLFTLIFYLPMYVHYRPVTAVDRVGWPVHPGLGHHPLFSSRERVL